MRLVYDDVKDFMALMGQEIPDKPTNRGELPHDARMQLQYVAEALKEQIRILTARATPEDHVALLRTRTMLEKLVETVEGMSLGNLVYIADGLVGSLYVTTITAATYGLPLPQLWGGVHDSHMEPQGEPLDVAGVIQEAITKEEVEIEGDTDPWDYMPENSKFRGQY